MGGDVRQFSYPVPDLKETRPKCLCESGRRELATTSFWKSLFAEFLGTLFYVVIGCGVIMSTPNWTSEPMKIALGFGFSATISSQMFGHISGGHYNPAVTLATVISTEITVIRGLLYVLCQCAGAITGTSILLGLSHQQNNTPELGALNKSEFVTVWQAVGVEFLLTFALVFCHLSINDQMSSEVGYRSIPKGLAVLGLHLFGIPLTGCGINPARALGPAIFSDTWTDHWIYWAGPMVAGIVAAILHQCVLTPFRKDFKDGEDGNDVGLPIGRFQFRPEMQEDFRNFGRRQSLWDRVYAEGALSSIYSPSLDYEIIPHFISENNV